MTDQWDAGRLDSDLEGVGFDTLAVRAGQNRTPEGEHSEALFLTSSYVFRTAADAAARFAGETPGNVYSRYTNPSVRAFEERLAAMEGAEQRRQGTNDERAIQAHQRVEVGHQGKGDALGDQGERGGEAGEQVGA